MADEKPDLKPTISGVYEAVDGIAHKMRISGIAAAVTLVGIVAGGVLSVINLSRSEAVAATVPAAEAVRATNTRVEFLKDELSRHVHEEAARHERFEAKIDRSDQKLELLLDAARVPLYRRPVGPDGWS